MAKLLRMSQFIKGHSALTPSRNEPLFPTPMRMDRDHFLASHMPEPVSGFPEQRLSLRFSIGAEARLLLVIGFVCGLLIYEGDKKSVIVNPKVGEQLQTTAKPQDAQPVRLLSKPTPIVQVGAARDRRSVLVKRSTDATPHPASSALHDTSISYEATRKKAFGGCNGQLELSGTGLVFRCPGQAEVILPVTAIARAHKDGILLKSGEKYHFLIANYTPAQVEAIFISWLSRVQQSPQSGAVSSLSKPVKP